MISRVPTSVISPHALHGEDVPEPGRGLEGGIPAHAALAVGLVGVAIRVRGELVVKLGQEGAEVGLENNVNRS